MTTPKIICIDYDRVCVAFGYVLTTLRKERNLSEEDFARSAGLDPAHYRGLESAAYGPSLYNLLRLAAAIDCKPEALVTATCERLVDLELGVKVAEAARAAGRPNPKG